MRLGTKGRYAVMAMIDIAVYSKGECVSLTSISKRNSISIPYLEQLFIKLKKDGLVLSYKGARGGYILTKHPNNISILEIIEAVDEKIDIVGCQEGRGCMSETKGVMCNSHDLWHNLMDNISKYLSSISLEDAIMGKEALPKGIEATISAINL